MLEVTAATEAYLLAQGADDEGNAQCVARLYGLGFLYCGAYGWMQYVGNHWRHEGADQALDRAIVGTLRARQHLALRAPHLAMARAAKPSTHHVRATKYLLRSLLPADVAEFDRSPDHLNVANGVLDLRTGDLARHDPAQRYSYCLQVDYDPAVDYGPWQAWVRQALADQSLGGGASPAVEAEAQYLQQAVGYTLTGHTAEEVLFCIHGPPRSGKGTFAEALLTLLAEPLGTEVGFGTLSRQRQNDTNSADLARLKPCRLVVTSEPPRDAGLNAAEVKRLTGGNLIFAALKYRDHFAYRPAYKIWLVSNHPPRADADDDALWSRLRVLSFPNSHVGREDRGLKARMKQAEMQRQILAWAVEGAQAWYRSAPGGLVTPPSIEEATRRARDAVDPVRGAVGQWLADCVIVTGEEDDFVSSAALQASYNAWRQEAGGPSQRIAGLTQALKVRGLEAGMQCWKDGRNQRGCRGIRLRE